MSFRKLAYFLETGKPFWLGQRSEDRRKARPRTPRKRRGRNPSKETRLAAWAMSLPPSEFTGTQSLAARWAGPL